MKIKLAGFAKESIVDGPGLRYTIFSQGCPHNCKGCHNPETHDFNKGFYYEIGDIVEEINANPLLDGVTFSGGEPFLQSREFLSLVKELNGCYEIYSYTGYYFEELLYMAKKDPAIVELLTYIDVLIDGPFIEKLFSYELKFKGSLNQRMINCKKSFLEGKVVLID